MLYDALADAELRSYAPHARWVNVGKRGFEHSAKQSEINTLLVETALQHRVVVRLKGGDASVFGRLEEELIALAEAGLDCEGRPRRHRSPRRRRAQASARSRGVGVAARSACPRP